MLCNFENLLLCLLQNRSRLADKCSFNKLPSYLADKSMAEGFPTMWRRNSTSSDEPEQAKSESLDDELVPQRSHSDEPRFYSPVDQVQVAKRPRSSSPDLERDRVNIKRRCMSETSAGIKYFISSLFLNSIFSSWLP